MATLSTLGTPTRPRSVHVEAKADHLQSLSRANPVTALAELIWNALDADADIARISIVDNDLGSPLEIHVADNGDGIPFEIAERAFGNLGDSWKKSRSHTPRTDRRLHGRDGKGRFKAFSLGQRVSWQTVYRDNDGHLYKYDITGTLQSICDFPLGEPVRADTRSIGTTVTISSITEPLGVLSADGPAIEDLTEHFAIHLRDYPDTRVFFRGQRLDPKAVQTAAKTMLLPEFLAADGTPVQRAVEVIEWKFAKKERKLCLCDASGYPLHEIDAGIRPGSEYNFTAYLKSDFIARLHERNLIGVAELTPDLLKLVESARDQLRAYFRRRKAETAGALVDEWKREGIYPFHGEAADTVERARREVFDICAVSINEHLDSFKQGGTKDRKFALQMIKTAVDEAPESLKRVLGEVLELPKEKLNDFAELLDYTTLTAMIEASKTVTDRLKFLQGLDEILFSQQLQRSTRERKHLQKILEGETWIFGEEYLLTNSDENLNTVLATHLDRLRPGLKRGRKKELPVLREDGSQGVIDLLLAREVPQYGRTRREFLVVELKRPSHKIDLQVKAQIESYALAVVKDPRFDVNNTFWTFIAVSTDMTEEAAETVAQQDKPVGFFLVRDNYKVGLIRWSEIIQASRTRLDLFGNKLDYAATRDDGIRLLHDKYRKFLPETIEEVMRA